MLPLLASVLAVDAGDADRRAGLLVFDVKGDMAMHLPRVMRAAGLYGSVLVLDRHRNSRSILLPALPAIRVSLPSASWRWFAAFIRRPRVQPMTIFGSRTIAAFFEGSAMLARARGLGDLRGLDGIASATAELVAVRHSGDEEARHAQHHGLSQGRT